MMESSSCFLPLFCTLKYRLCRNHHQNKTTLGFHLTADGDHMTRRAISGAMESQASNREVCHKMSNSPVHKTGSPNYEQVLQLLCNEKSSTNAAGQTLITTHYMTDKLNQWTIRISPCVFNFLSCTRAIWLHILFRWSKISPSEVTWSIDKALQGSSRSIIDSEHKSS